ncbi:hypothetical protein [Fusicatenibacter sp.]
MSAPAAWGKPQNGTAKHRPTGGCIGVPEEQMVTIMKNIQTGCQIIIDSASGLKNY